MKKQTIDFVITWVDGNDPLWQKERKKYEPKQNKDKKEEGSETDIREVRYRDYGILKYWFRAVEKYAPWVHKIFFVTWGHIPEWLDLTNPKLVIVKHEDFIPKEYLPTFNSNVIEMNFHRIKGLANQFVSFNDDVLLTSLVNDEDFFQNGLPCDQLESRIVYNYNLEDIFPHTEFNNMGIINRNFTQDEKLKHKDKWISERYIPEENKWNELDLNAPRYLGFKDYHVSIPFLKSTFVKVWEKEGALLDQICRHRFRTPMDVSIWFIRYWQLIEGNFEIRNMRDFGRYFTLALQNSRMYDAIQNETYHVICINDKPNPEKPFNFEQKKKELEEVFQNKHPKKSSFER